MYGHLLPASESQTKQVLADSNTHEPGISFLFRWGALTLSLSGQVVSVSLDP